MPCDCGELDTPRRLRHYMGDPMTLDQFWAIVADFHRDAGGDMDAKCKLLEHRLRQLPEKEVLSFCRHFDDLEDRAYNHELWAAAYIIGHGCSDDAFSDFRSTLISMGRDVFEKTLADPEYLADVNYDAESAHYEGYQHVPTQVYKELSGGFLPGRIHDHPSEPSGNIWDEGQVAQIFPKLAKQYKYGVRKRSRVPFARLFRKSGS